jgi:hypothetical protein
MTFGALPPCGLVCTNHPQGRTGASANDGIGNNFSYFLDKKIYLM